ncbi:MAG: purine-nucleoside phosphorylase [Ignavibacteriae bacterium]|nr:MAG: purine-nucleoside phosphorylase [Ignavibacteriota bacterium]
MTEQKTRILESVNYIKQNSPFKKSPPLAVISYFNPLFLKYIQVQKRIDYSAIPPAFGKENTGGGEFIFAYEKTQKREFYVLNGRFNYYEGYSMRDVVHPVYVLKELGVKTIVFIDEVGHLNPRFKVGGVSFLYDHINLMGDNPLIGENDYTLGPRFPDMSNPYDDNLYRKLESLFIDNQFRIYPSVYLGVTGPETETEAECRFYREIGADVLGYSLVPENLAAIHSGIKCAAFGMISRELVADRLKEIGDEEQRNNRLKAEKNFNSILPEIIGLIK